MSKENNMSGSLLFGFADVSPVNIGAHLFARDGALCGALDSWAIFSGELALSVSPEADGLGGYTKGSRHFRRAANDLDCLSNWVHVENSTCVDRKVQHVYLFLFLRLFKF